MPKKSALAIAGPVTAETETPSHAEQKLAAILEERAKPKPIPLGLHFGLDEDVYHADSALGSTDLRRLAKNPYNFWYNSWMNPLRPQRDDDTESKLVGAALHKLIFEGRDAFDALYVSGPDQTGMTTAEKTASTKAANVAATTTGKTSLKFDKYARILMASAMITKNPFLKNVFSDGFGEVSVFWEVAVDGTLIRLKSRFDYLKCTERRHGPGGPRFMMAANGDLKSVANPHEKDFITECYEAIARYRYDAQAALYLNGLTQVRQCVLEERVFGVDSNDAAMWKWLERFLAKDVRFGWQWIFHQMTGAPITHSMSLSPQNPILDAGRQVIHRGLERYAKCMKEFGSEEMWLLVEEPREAMMESMPGWYGRN